MPVHSWSYCWTYIFQPQYYIWTWPVTLSVIEHTSCFILLIFSFNCDALKVCDWTWHCGLSGVFQNFPLLFTNFKFGMMYIQTPGSSRRGISTVVRCRILTLGLVVGELRYLLFALFMGSTALERTFHGSAFPWLFQQFLQTVLSRTEKWANAQRFVNIFYRAEDEWSSSDAQWNRVVSEARSWLSLHERVVLDGTVPLGNFLLTQTFPQSSGWEKVFQFAFSILLYIFVFIKFRIQTRIPTYVAMHSKFESLDQFYNWTSVAVRNHMKGFGGTLKLLNSASWVTTGSELFWGMWKELSRAQISEWVYPSFKSGCNSGANHLVIYKSYIFVVRKPLSDSDMNCILHYFKVFWMSMLFWW